MPVNSVFLRETDIRYKVEYDQVQLSITRES